MSSTGEENPLNSLIITRESVNNLGPEDDPGPRKLPNRTESPEENRKNQNPDARQDTTGQETSRSTGEKVAIGGHQRSPLNMSQIEQLKSENLNLKRVLDEKETLISVLTSNLHSVIEERNNLKILALKNANDDIITPSSGSGYDHLLQKPPNDSNTGGYVGLSSLIGSLGSQNPVGSMMTPDRTSADNGGVRASMAEVSVKQEINGQDEMTIEEVDSSMTSSAANDVIVPNVLNRSNFGISLGNQKIDLGEFLNSIKELGQGQAPTGLDLIQSLNQKGGKKRRKEVDEEMASIAKKASLEDIKVGFKITYRVRR